MSVYGVCFMVDCVGVLFVECVCNVCGDEVIDLSLKVFVLFLGYCVVFVLANPCVVFQRICVLCL